jgi:acid phosphatase type 7
MIGHWPEAFVRSLNVRKTKGSVKAPTGLFVASAEGDSRGVLCCLHPQSMPAHFDTGPHCSRRRSCWLGGMSLKKLFALSCSFALLFAGCRRKNKPTPANLAEEREAAAKTAAVSPGVPVLVGAGDVAGCDTLDGAEATARLLDHIPGTVFLAGDAAYEDGTEEQFAQCYDPTWGRHKARTRPAPGNHDYNTRHATPYFRYFGMRAGDPQRGYYSYDLGGWHIVVINSVCDGAGGCDGGSPQERWLRQDLAQHPAACTLAYWHYPLFSSGAKHGNDLEMKPFWQALYSAGAEIVINGHDHDYERFAPQDPDGRPDPARGIREFVVGTGGRSTRPFADPQPNSEVRNTGTFGVLKITLHPNSYDWRFIPVAGKAFTDSGSGACH